MKTHVVRFALFPLLALSALSLRPSAFAQGTVSLPLGNTYQVKWDNAGSFTPVPVGNPAQLGIWGQLNIQVYYAPVGTASPFTAFGAGLIPAPWTASSTTPLHQITTIAGWTPATTFTLPTAAGGANTEVMVVGWTGNAPDWNSALELGGSRLAWTGSTLSGGALAWVNGTGNPNASPPATPVALVTGALGYNGLAFDVPEPCSFALAGLGAVMLMVFHRRR